MDDRYPPGILGVPTSPMWDFKTGHLKKEWKTVMEKHPWNFMSALDMGSDRLTIGYFQNQLDSQKYMLAEFSPQIAEIIAYKAAWKLLFNEEI